MKQAFKPFVFLGLILATGVLAEAADNWTTSQEMILNPVGGQFIIAGVNWYGFETTSYVAHGLYSQDYITVLNEIKQYSYNTIRIPFSNQMWETNPIPGSSRVTACAACKGKHSRDILSMIINYAGSIGLHVILDNHRSEVGNSNEANGLWYIVSRTNNYPESSWTNDWVHIEDWINGVTQTQGAADTITVSKLASDGYPVVLGFDLRNEPHSVCNSRGCNYLSGSTWGTGDGIDPSTNPNPNPFSPACISSSTCHDWRLAAERAGDSILGEAISRGWALPLIFVEGVSQYPTFTGTPANGPFDYYWDGGELLGVNGNAKNPGAPVVLNAGGDANNLGTAVPNQVVYSAHDYGPSLYKQPWFNSSTCYITGCSSSSLADIWNTHWASITTGNVNPVWPGHPSYPWDNTGASAYSAAPVWIGEFGTGNATSDLSSPTAGSQGQWFTDFVAFIQSSYATNPANDPHVLVRSLNWTYWALNGEDSYSLLGTNYTGLVNPAKQYTFLCSIQQPPFALPAGSGTGQCGSTGSLPQPH
jgi:aryl-phospho-beta-D-glucosidase BglC (GH1 family)